MRAKGMEVMPSKGKAEGVKRYTRAMVCAGKGMGGGGGEDEIKRWMIQGCCYRWWGKGMHGIKILGQF
jgi:hypothetical protein